MERRRLKTVMILILALTNVFLLLNLGRYRLEEASARRQASARLVDLLAADGLLLDPSLISGETPPDPVLLSRDERLEASVAHWFLKGDMGITRQGDEWTYTAGTASARFQGDGSFAVTGLEEENGAELCGQFCRDWDYRPPDPDTVLNGPVTVNARFGGTDVYNCTVTFSFEDGILRGVTGTLLSGGTPVPAERALLSGSGALTAFQAAYQRTGADPVRVSEMSLCWAVRGGAGRSLVPAWRITAGDRTCYVDCVDGTVSALGTGTP